MTFVCINANNNITNEVQSLHDNMTDNSLSNNVRNVHTKPSKNGKSHISAFK